VLGKFDPCPKDGLGDLSLERQASDLALDGWVCQSVSDSLKRREHLTLGEQRPGDDRGKAKEMERKGWGVEVYHRA